MVSESVRQAIDRPNFIRWYSCLELGFERITLLLQQLKAFCVHLYTHGVFMHLEHFWLDWDPYPCWLHPTGLWRSQWLSQLTFHSFTFSACQSFLLNDEIWWVNIVWCSCMKWADMSSSKRQWTHIKNNPNYILILLLLQLYNAHTEFSRCRLESHSVCSRLLPSSLASLRSGCCDSGLLHQ